MSSAAEYDEQVCGIASFSGSGWSAVGWKDGDEAESAKQEGSDG